MFLFLITRENARLRPEASQYSGALAGPQTAQVYDASAKYLLYIFSPGCSVCVNQISAWNSLTLQASSKNIKVLGLSLDSASAAKGHLKDVQYNFDVVVIPSKAIQRAYRVVSIPQVMLVSPNGIVEWVNYGELSESATGDLLSKIESNR